jgi:hypothetical protein
VNTSANTDTSLIVEDLESIRAKYQASQARLGQLIHENERLRLLVGEQVAIRKHEPAIILDCSAPGCVCPPLTRAVAPPEDAIPGWVRGMDWGLHGGRRSVSVPGA